jgi:hypothetical protein
MKEYEMFGRFGKGSHRASPTPVAIADFKNGTYSINGVTKTLGEVFTASADWAPWDEAAVVPGVGLQACSRAMPRWVQSPRQRCSLR